MPQPHPARLPRAAAAAALALMPLIAPASGLSPLGIFDHHQDVGDPRLAGSAVFDPDDQTYTLSGAGVNMWGAVDQFHFAWKRIRGDFMIQATVRFIGEGVDPHRKIGIIARDTLTTDSRYADACVHGDTLTSLQYRPADGALTDQVVIHAYHPTDIQFSRRGNVFTLQAATFGESFKAVTHEMELAEEVYAGLFICSHREDVVEQAVFSNVRITIPAAPDFVPYRDYLGSRLEVLDVATGLRRVLHEEPRSLQAPNWTTDGTRLIYNAEGLLYTYELATGRIAPLPTGPADQNNNDHVLSFDGAMLGISHHVGEQRISTIYTLPATGSDQPEQITDPARGHAFLHGWSPDARRLIFTGQRNNQWDIWAIDIATREETNLTNNPTLDDGAEYTPDGRWIYFNSVRTGTMQIWRMRPDGGGQEQVTFDEYNNWFPHISPDGQWIVFLAYPPDIDPNDHPWYKQVHLRLMSAGGGVPRTIAYIYGGQGTINVPSWSPDSRRLAFVSNSRL